MPVERFCSSLGSLLLLLILLGISVVASAANECQECEPDENTEPYKCPTVKCPSNRPYCYILGQAGAQFIVKTCGSKSFLEKIEFSKIADIDNDEYTACGSVKKDKLVEGMEWAKTSGETKGSPLSWNWTIPWDYIGACVCDPNKHDICNDGIPVDDTGMARRVETTTTAITKSGKSGSGLRWGGSVAVPGVVMMMTMVLVVSAVSALINVVINSNV